MLTETKITWEVLQALIADASRGVAVPEDAREALGEEIMRCEVMLGGGLYRQLLCLRLFDEAEGWEGWNSLEAWMTVKLGLSYKTANERLRVARRLAELPKIDAAFREGRLSYTKVRALHDVATPENEETLLEMALSASGEQLRRLLSPLRAAVKRSASTQAALEQERRVYFVEHPGEDLVELRATLLPEEAAAVRKMLEVALELEAKLRRSTSEPRAGGGSAAAESGATASRAPEQGVGDSAAAESRATNSAATNSGTTGQGVGDSASAEVSAQEQEARDSSAPNSRAPNSSVPDSGKTSEGLGVRDSAATKAPPAASDPGHREPSRAAGSPSGRAGARWEPDSAAADLHRARFTLVDALVFAAESFLANPPRAGVPAGRREILIHAYPDSTKGDAPGEPNLGSGLLETGQGLSAETVQRLACDGATVRIERGPKGEILDVGRRTRRIGRTLGRALEVRDRCCRFPGCTRRAMLDAHHIVAWSQGGKTKLSNLVRLCRTHHRDVHEGGWSVQRDSEGRIEFLDPRGARVASPGRLPEVTASEAHAALSGDCRSRGLESEPEQLTAREGGAPVDYHYASSVLADCCGFDSDPGHPDQLPPAIRWLRDKDVA